MKKPLSNAALAKILETANERDLFIVGHMYIENTIDRIRLDQGKCEEKCRIASQN